jgi:hypothetical protein
MLDANGKRSRSLIGEQTVYAALDAIDQALEQALAARTESQRNRQLAELRGLLLTLSGSGLDLEDALQRLIAVLQRPTAGH